MAHGSRLMAHGQGGPARLPGRRGALGPDPGRGPGRAPWPRGPGRILLKLAFDLRSKSLRFLYNLTSKATCTTLDSPWKSSVTSLALSASLRFQFDPNFLLRAHFNVTSNVFFKVNAALMSFSVCFANLGNLPFVSMILCLLCEGCDGYRCTKGLHSFDPTFMKTK